MAHMHCMLDNYGHRYTQNMEHLLLFHGKSSYSNAPQCYVYKYTAFPDYN